MGGTRRRGIVLVGVSSLSVVYIAVPLLLYGAYVLGHLTEVSFTGTMDPALVTLEATTFGALFCVVVAVPLAFIVARSRSPFARIVGVVMRVPLGIPPLVAGLMVLMTVGPYTFLGRFSGDRLVNSFLAVLIVQAFVALPIIFEGARASFRQIDEASELFAETLGMRAPMVFLLVAVPAAWSGIRSGVALGWLRAFGEFGAVVLVAYHPYTLAVFTYIQISGYGLPATLGVSVLCIGLGALGSMLILAARFPRGVSIALSKRMVHSSGVRSGGDVHPTARAVPTVAFSVRGSVGDFSVAIESPQPSSAIAILGYSGAGKSLALSALCGTPRFDGAAQRVSLIIGTESGVVSSGWLGRYRVSSVPQGGGLFPGYTALEQLQIASASTSHGRGLLEEVLESLPLAPLLPFDTSQLSGGERQLVSLARSLVTSPDLLLLDEPFSAMDAPLRLRTIGALSRWTTRHRVAMVVVSHSVDDVMILGEYLLVVSDGVVCASGTPAALWRDPGSVTAAELLGHRNVVPASDVGLSAPSPDVLAVVDPSTITLSKEREHAMQLRCTVEGAHFISGRIRVQLGVSGTSTMLIADIPDGPESLDPGERVYASVPSTPLSWVHL